MIQVPKPEPQIMILVGAAFPTGSMTSERTGLF